MSIMYEAIKDFNKQFSYEPEIMNENALIKEKSFVIVGMGGSAQAPKILKTWKPSLDMIIHSDYGLPELSTEEFKNKLIILSSYSGNTEEVIEAFKEARDKNLNMAVISVGGGIIVFGERK